MESKNLHERIRASTHAHHVALENTPPFSRLTAEDVTPEEVHWSLALFSDFFMDYLNFKRAEHSFFSEKLTSLDSYGGSAGGSSFSGLNGLEVLAWDYIFLGSQLGNRMILARNRVIQALESADYFKVAMPQEIWRKCLGEISEVSEVVDQNFLVDRISELFQELRGLALTSRR